MIKSNLNDTRAYGNMFALGLCALLYLAFGVALPPSSPLCKPGGWRAADMEHAFALANKMATSHAQKVHVLNYCQWGVTAKAKRALLHRVQTQDAATRIVVLVSACSAWELWNTIPKVFYLAHIVLVGERTGVPVILSRSNAHVRRALSAM